MDVAHLSSPPVNTLHRNADYPPHLLEEIQPTNYLTTSNGFPINFDIPTTFSENIPDSVTFINTEFSGNEIGNNMLAYTGNPSDLNAIESIAPRISSMSQPVRNISSELYLNSYSSQPYGRDESYRHHLVGFSETPLGTELHSEHSSCPALLPSSISESSGSTGSSSLSLPTLSGHHSNENVSDTCIVENLTDSISNKLKCDRCSAKKIQCSDTFPCKKCQADGEDCTISISRKKHPGTCMECFRSRIKCVGSGDVCFACKLFKKPHLCRPVRKPVSTSNDDNSRQGYPGKRGREDDSDDKGGDRKKLVTRYSSDGSPR